LVCWGWDWGEGQIVSLCDLGFSFVFFWMEREEMVVLAFGLLGHEYFVHVLLIFSNASPSNINFVYCEVWKCQQLSSSSLLRCVRQCHQSHERKADLASLKECLPDRGHFSRVIRRCSSRRHRLLARLT
jgi:hypothetical protein